MTPIQYDSMITQFIAEVPELSGLYRYQADLWETPEDPLSPHLFFDTPMSKAVELLYVLYRDEHNQHAKAIIDRILNFVEHAIQSDDSRVVDVIYTGFLESSYITGRNYDEVTALYLPETRKGLAIVQQHYPKPVIKPDERLPFEDGSLNFLHDCIAILKKPPKLKHLKKFRNQARRETSRTQRKAKKKPGEPGSHVN